MICKKCCDGSPEECANYVDSHGVPREPVGRAWCDSQHKTGVYVDPMVCRHSARTQAGIAGCPSCGRSIEVTVTRTMWTGEVIQAEEGASPDG